MEVVQSGIRKTLDGSLYAAPGVREGSWLTAISVNFCDMRTWYAGSQRVLGELLTDTGDGLTFTSVHGNWIDLTHGRFSHEDSVSVAYLPAVYVGGVQKAERAPFAGAGGDFTVDYVTGRVTFLAPPVGPVTADYSYAATSEWILRPDAGKKLRILFVEAQFSKDVVINDTVVFQPYGLVDVFAPQLVPGIPSGTKIPLGAPTKYKRASDFVNEATGNYPVLPGFGGAARGFAQDLLSFRWNYLAVRDLLSSAGMEVRVSLESHQVFGGEFSTASFYCLVENE